MEKLLYWRVIIPGFILMILLIIQTWLIILSGGFVGDAVKFFFAMLMLIVLIIGVSIVVALEIKDRKRWVELYGREKDGKL